MDSLFYPSMKFVVKNKHQGSDSNFITHKKNQHFHVNYIITPLPKEKLHPLLTNKKISIILPIKKDKDYIPVYDKKKLPTV